MSRTIDHPALPLLKARFPDAGLRVGEFRDMTTVVIPRERITEVCAFLRDEPALAYDYLSELNGIDYLNYPGAADRFGITYGLVSVEKQTPRLWLKVFLNPEHSTAPGSQWVKIRDEEAAEKSDPGLRMPSVCSVWPGAEWMEREVYDMLGVVFTGHPDLRRIFTWNGYDNYPLRKDYPLRGVGERENYKIITREGA